MTNEEKHRFDAFSTISNTGWVNFRTRREFEWKYLLVVWAGYLSYILAVLNGKIVIESFPLMAGTTIVGGLIFIMTRYNILSFGSANRFDRLVAIEMEKEMLKILNYQWGDDIKQEIIRRKKHFGLKGNWSHRFQVWITFLLYATSVIACFAVHR